MPDIPPDLSKGGSASPGSASSGFELDSEAVIAQAATLDGCSEELMGLLLSLRNVRDGYADVFGADGAPEAYSNFASRMVDELVVQSGALDELADKLRVSVSNYEFLEEFGAAGLQAVGALIGTTGSAADPQGSGVLGRIGQILDDLTFFPGSPQPG